MNDTPAAAHGSPPDSFVNLSALIGGSGAATILGSGQITLQFENEAASWLELESDDLTDAAAAELRIGISENRLRAPQETGSPQRVEGTTFRLQLNPQLYEGVSFAFLNITQPPARPWRLRAVRRITQAVPANYGGSLDASDGRLARLWWVGAYTTRATFVSERDPKTNTTTAYLGSILMNRGDRIAFLGDAHVAQATALAAFTMDTHALLLASLRYTSTGSGSGIEPYLLMWVNSVCDFFDATNDTAALLSLAPAVSRREGIPGARLAARRIPSHGSHGSQRFPAHPRQIPPPASGGGAAAARAGCRVPSSGGGRSVAPLVQRRPATGVWL